MTGWLGCCSTTESAAQIGSSPATSPGGKAFYEPAILNVFFSAPRATPAPVPALGCCKKPSKVHDGSRPAPRHPGEFLPIVWPGRTGNWARRLALRDATGAGHERRGAWRFRDSEGNAIDGRGQFRSGPQGL